MCNLYLATRPSSGSPFPILISLPQWEKSKKTDSAYKLDRLLMAHQLPGNAATGLDLDSLIHGYRHLPREGAAMMVQAAVVCLEDRGHASGARLTVDGSFTATFAVTWAESATEAVRR